MRALIASGSGPYADPWHPFPETSAAVAEILGTDFDVEVHTDLDAAMERLDGVDLLVVNAGDPWPDDAGRAPASAVQGFAAALDRGIGVLALHCAVSSMRDYPQWAPAIGAVWLPEVSFHPPAGIARIEGGSAAGIDVPDFRVQDERYCRLQHLGPKTAVAHHRHDGRREPTAWVRRVGRSRVAVDVLGHDARSYEAAEHRGLVRDLARWATADRAG
ncbi:MAG: ThuA protein [Microbacterium sp.]|nr:ThuA protein [Microbacterium sp.]